MNKQFKKIVAFALAGLLLLSSFSGFNVNAATTSDAQKIARILELKVITGEDGVIDLDKDFTRYRAFTMMVRLLGLEDELEAFEYDENDATFADADAENTSPFVKNLMAFIKAHPELGISGYPDGTLQPYSDITSREYAKILLEVLGYSYEKDFTWETTQLTAQIVGIVNSSSDLSDADKVPVSKIAVLSYNTLGTTPKNADKPLGEILGFPIVEAPKHLEVDSVSITNYKEVEIKFTKEIDTKLAAELAHYEVKVGTLVKSLDNALVLDENTVRLTLADGQEVPVQSNVTVTVKKSIGLQENYATTLNNVIDREVPQVEDVILTGPASFEIIFSEPLNKTVNPVVLINNGVYGSSVQKIVGRVVYVTLPGSLPEQTYELSIKGARDLAGYAMADTTRSFEYKKVTEDLTATVLSATQNQVVIQFNQKLNNPSAINTTIFYHSYSVYRPDSVVVGADGRTVTLNFNTNMIPAGNRELIVRTSGLQSEWGNKAPSDIALPISIVIDNEPPTVALDKVTAENEFVLVFDKDVKLSDATNRANYTITDSNNKALNKILSIAYDSTTHKATVTLTEKLAGGNYTVVVKDIVDNSPQENKLVSSAIAFTVTDKTAPIPQGAEIVPAEKVIYVTFNEAMDSSVLDVNNWRYQGQRPTKSEFFGATTKVKLTFDKAITLDANDSVYVGQVSDLAGNKIDAFQTLVSVNELAYVNIASAKSIAKNKVEIVLNGKILEGIAADNFTFENADGSESETAAYVSYTYNNEGQTVIIATMKSTVTFKTDEAPASITIDGDKLKADTGVNVTSTAFTTATDGIAPELDKKASTIETDKATLVFSEELSTAYATLIATELNVSYNGSLLRAGLDYTTSVEDNAVVVTFHMADGIAEDGKLTIASKSTSYLLDASKNKAEEFTLDLELKN